jgi:hypothetical protein
VTVVQTLLVFAAAPLAVYLLLWAMTYLPGGRKRQGLKYKPGQAWDHEPLWYEPQPANAATHAAGQGDTQAVGSSLYGETASIGSGHDDGSGSGSGSTHGATAISSGAPVPAAGGPLGGARGTW